ncbi:MAG: DUF721 domain-containing protein [Polyangiales bacterium]
MIRRRNNYEPIGTAHIGTLLAEALRDPRRIREALGVWPAWEEAVGPEIAAAARPVALRDGVLTLHVKHPVWLQELHQQRHQLLRRVQRHPAGAAVKELRFKVGAMPRVAEPAAPPPDPVRPGPIPYEVTRAIRAVDSPQLRGALIRVASRWAGLQRDRNSS